MSNRTEPMVSVLVPIYNVEKYLRQCLGSLRNQTLKNIEIICINDGSTDGSLEIIEEFAKDDERFVVINKENSGYGDSMNQGLAKARGKYIGIVESDDWIDTRAFEELVEMAEENDVEVVRANYYQNKDGVDMKMRMIRIHETNRIIDPQYHTWLFLLPPAIWSAIYRRDFLEKNQIKFLPTPGASYQDTGFAFKVWATAKRVWLTTNAYLHYRIDNAASSVNNPGKVFCVCEEYDEIERYLREKDLFEELGAIMWTQKMATYYWNALRLDGKLLNTFFRQIMPGVKVAIDEGVLPVDYFLADPNNPIGRTANFLAEGKIRAAMKVVRIHQRNDRRIEKYRNSKWHIYRTKAFRIERLIVELEEQSELLEQQIKDLRAKAD